VDHQQTTLLFVDKSSQTFVCFLGEMFAFGIGAAGRNGAVCPDLPLCVNDFGEGNGMHQLIARAASAQ
jgi:hypothetical protein